MRFREDDRIGSVKVHSTLPLVERDDVALRLMSGNFPGHDMGDVSVRKEAQHAYRGWASLGGREKISG
jgi:hypothetical protein